MSPDRLGKYIDLIESFLGHQVEAHDFETLYLSIFKADDTDWPDDEYNALQELFADVDAFCEDPTLRGPGDLDEEQLRVSAGLALEKLRALNSPDTERLA